MSIELYRLKDGIWVDKYESIILYPEGDAAHLNETFTYDELKAILAKMKELQSEVKK